MSGGVDASGTTDRTMHGAALVAFRSGYVPRFVGVLLVIAGIGYLVDSFGTLLVASYSLKVGTVTFVGEVVLMIWLLVKGRNVSGNAATV